jgi:hypothetical protein
MAGCGDQIEVYVPRGYDYKPINVRCGNTSPSGCPWLCETCDKMEGHRDWRAEAEEAGEQWDDDY